MVHGDGRLTSALRTPESPPCQALPRNASGDIERDPAGFEVMLLRGRRVETRRADCLAAALAIVADNARDAAH